MGAIGFDFDLEAIAAGRGRRLASLKAGKKLKANDTLALAA